VLGDVNLDNLMSWYGCLIKELGLC